MKWPERPEGPPHGGTPHLWLDPSGRLEVSPDFAAQADDRFEAVCAELGILLARRVEPVSARVLPFGTEQLAMVELRDESTGSAELHTATARGASPAAAVAGAAINAATGGRNVLAAALPIAVAEGKVRAAVVFGDGEAPVRWGLAEDEGRLAALYAVVPHLGSFTATAGADTFRVLRLPGIGVSLVSEGAGAAAWVEGWFAALLHATQFALRTSPPATGVVAQPRPSEPEPAADAAAARLLQGLEEECRRILTAAQDQAREIRAAADRDASALAVLAGEAQARDAAHYDALADLQDRMEAERERFARTARGAAEELDALRERAAAAEARVAEAESRAGEAARKADDERARADAAERAARRAAETAAQLAEERDFAVATAREQARDELRGEGEGPARAAEHARATILADAKRESEGLLRDAERTRSTLLEDARRQSGDLLRDTERTSRELLADAKRDGERLLRDAERARATILEDARREADDLLVAADRTRREAQNARKDAEHDARSVLASAEGDAERVRRDAKQQGGRLISDARGLAEDVIKDARRLAEDLVREAAESRRRLLDNVTRAADRASSDELRLREELARSTGERREERPAPAVAASEATASPADVDGATVAVSLLAAVAESLRAMSAALGRTDLASANTATFAAPGADAPDHDAPRRIPSEDPPSPRDLPGIYYGA